MMIQGFWNIQPKNHQTKVLKTKQCTAKFIQLHENPIKLNWYALQKKGNLTYMLT